MSLLAKETGFMKTQLVSAIVVILIVTNILTVNQVTSKYESKLETKSKIIKQLHNGKSQQTEQLRSQSLEIHIIKDQLKKEVKRRQQVSRGVVNKKQRSFYVEASAYTSDCKGCSGFTFTEHDVRNTVEYHGLRIIAADLSVIPLYSIVRIDTKKESFYAIAIDTGGAIKGLKVDILVNTYDEAIQFGKQDVLITILREGKGK